MLAQDGPVSAYFERPNEPGPPLQLYPSGKDFENASAVKRTLVSGTLSTKITLFFKSFFSRTMPFKKLKDKKKKLDAAIHPMNQFILSSTPLRPPIDSEHKLTANIVADPNVSIADVNDDNFEANNEPLNDPASHVNFEPYAFPDSSSLDNVSPSLPISDEDIIKTFKDDFLPQNEASLDLGPSLPDLLIRQCSSEASCPMDNLQRPLPMHMEPLKDSGDCMAYLGHQCTSSFDKLNKCLEMKEEAQLRMDQTILSLTDAPFTLESSKLHSPLEKSLSDAASRAIIIIPSASSFSPSRNNLNSSTPSFFTTPATSKSTPADALGSLTLETRTERPANGRPIDRARSWSGSQIDRRPIPFAMALSYFQSMEDDK